MLAGIEYKDRDLVTIEITPDQKGVGMIRGLAHEFTHINMWIVEILNWGTIKHDAYQWTCLIVPSSNLTIVPILSPEGW